MKRESAPLLRLGRSELPRLPGRTTKGAKESERRRQSIRLSKDNQTNHLRRGRRHGIPDTAPTRLRRVGNHAGLNKGERLGRLG